MYEHLCYKTFFDLCMSHCIRNDDTFMWYYRRNDVMSFVGELRLQYSRRNDVMSFVGELIHIG